jgi:hypothetical protein
MILLLTIITYEYVVLVGVCMQGHCKLVAVVLKVAIYF